MKEYLDIHWLFSKDSGLMEFVEWEVTSKTIDYLYDRYYPHKI